MPEKVIYLDNNATTAVAPEVLDAMLPFLRERYGNPSSIHRFGGLVRRNIDAARGQVAALLGCHAEEIFFTSCGSESDSMAIVGFAKTHKARTRIITSAVEHPAVRTLCASLKAEGVEVIEIGVDANGLLRRRACTGSACQGGVLPYRCRSGCGQNTDQPGNRRH
jgi:cysteine desulfurase